MLDNCDPVCMNCHRIRELRRDGTLNESWWAKWTKRLIPNRGALISE